MTLHLIRKSISGSRFQKILSFITILASTLLLSCMLNITLGISNQIAKDLRGYGSNIVVLPKGAALNIEIGDKIFSPLENESYLEESKLHLIKEIFWRNNITAFAPFLDAEVSVKKMVDSSDSVFIESTAGNLSHKNNEIKVILSGTYFDKNIGVKDEPDFSTGVKSLYPTWEVRGEWVEDLAMDSILVGSEIAKRENIGVGDILRIESNESIFTLKVRGILHNSGIYDNRIISSLALAQAILGKEGVFAKAEVSAFTIPENSLSYKARRNLDSLDALEFDTWYCSAFVSSIVYQIEEDFKGASAKAQIKVSDAESLVVRKIQWLMAVTSIICLFVASVGISAALSAEFQRRRKEIGLMKVLGANIWQIYALFAGENCVIAIVGAILGFFAGVGISEIISISIFSHLLPISWIALPLSIAFALFIAIFGSLLLLKNINTLLPADVLYGR